MSIWTLSISLLGCQTQPIPNVEFIRVIPFDPPEAASVELVSRKKRLYTPAEADQLIPYLTCLTPEGVQEIIKNGKMQCRFDTKNGKTCEVKLDSVNDTVRELDAIAEKLLGGTL